MMSYILVLLLAVSIGAALLTGSGNALGAAVPLGAQAGFQLALSMAGSLCLWTGVGKLMEISGLTGKLSRLLRPLLAHLFPESRKDPGLAGDLSANLCANFLGLGNAATPMGIRAARRLRDTGKPGTASDSLCRLVVLNTASIQLIPANVAAIRAANGSPSPFDILPAVWVTSLLSAGAGLLAAWLIGKVWPHG